MARYTIIYPDGSKKNIGASERQQLLLANEINQIDQRHYAYHGQVRTYHSFADLSGLKHALKMPTQALRAYLPGSFVFVEPRTAKRRREALETVEHMCMRLELA